MIYLYIYTHNKYIYVCIYIIIIYNYVYNIYIYIQVIYPPTMPTPAAAGGAHQRKRGTGLPPTPGVLLSGF